MFGIFSEWVWRRLLHRPYKLAVPVLFGSGQPVMLLHGIASDHNNWTHVLPHITKRCRVIVPDLLGFGRSPQPRHALYTIEEQAQLVLDTLDRLDVHRPVILVGHSMGSLVAVEIAKQRPELVKKLILCGMPVYLSHPPKTSNSMYFSIYKYLIDQPQFTLKSAALITKLLPHIIGFSLDKRTWRAFRLSLQNGIMQQTTYADMQHLRMPIEIVCGKFDMFVVRRNLESLVSAMDNATMYAINERHEITRSYGEFVAERIDSALARTTAKDTDQFN